MDPFFCSVFDEIDFILQRALVGELAQQPDYLLLAYFYGNLESQVTFD